MRGCKEVKVLKVGEHYFAYITHSGVATMGSVGSVDTPPRKKKNKKNNIHLRIKKKPRSSLYVVNALEKNTKLPLPQRSRCLICDMHMPWMSRVQVPFFRFNFFKFFLHMQNSDISSSSSLVFSSLFVDCWVLSPPTCDETHTSTHTPKSQPPPF